MEQPLQSRAQARSGVRGPALVTGLRLISIVLVGLVAGVGLGVALLYRNLPGPASFYAQFQQLVIASYRPVPVLVVAAVLTAVGVLVLVRRDKWDFMVTLAGLLCIVASLLITLIVLGPLNTEVAAWSVDAVPAGWSQTRDRWESANVVREVAVVAGFVLLLVAGLRRRPA